MLLGLAASAGAQDMPLSQIIPAEGGWVPMKSPIPEPKPDDGARSRVVTAAGIRYAVYPGERSVAITTADGQTRRQGLPLREPSGLALWAGEGTLVVADAGGRHLWAFPLRSDGLLAEGQPYYPLRVRREATRSEAGSMALDETGRLFVTTSEGVQVFDPTGRLSGVLLSPTRGSSLEQVWFGGPDGKTLMVSTGRGVFGRPMLAKGLRPATDTR
jgi:sugar lactone lactonase YvrE